MAYEEKRAWIYAVASVVAYAFYAVTVLSRAGDTPLTQVRYVTTLLWTIGLSIAVQIVLSIAASMASPRERDKKDQRDREIGRFGEHIGQSLVVIGGVAALVLAMVEADYFWIANVLFLCFTLSAVLSSVAKIFAYRRGFHPW
jgi:cell division protein FtsW (lipid II flippase)